MSDSYLISTFSSKVNINKDIILIDNSSENDLFSLEKDIHPLSLKKFKQVNTAINYIKQIWFKDTIIIINNNSYSEFIESFNDNIKEVNFFPKIIINNNKKKNFIQNNDNFFCKYKVATSIEEIKTILNELNTAINFDSLEYDAQLTFEKIDSTEKLILPLLYKILIDLVDKDGNNIFIEYIYKKYSNNNFQIKDLLQQIISKANIPLEILSKYYIRLFTMESEFYKDLNKDLRLNEKEKYMPYIQTLYEGIKLKALPLASDNELYRGSQISNNEIENLKNYCKKKLKHLPGAIVFSRSFLSFSKNKAVAEKFLKNINIYNNNLSKVLFILEKDDSIGYDLSTHCDIEKLSFLPNEKEVLFLPFSSFAIKEINEINWHNDKIYEIKLLYLGKYLEDLKKKEIFK